MLYKVFGAESCPTCIMAKDRILEAGNDVEYHDAEYHMSGKAEDWRDRSVDFVDLFAQLSMDNLEFPAVYCVDTEEWISMAGSSPIEKLENLDDHLSLYLSKTA